MSPHKTHPYAVLVAISPPGGLVLLASLAAREVLQGDMIEPMLWLYLGAIALVVGVLLPIVSGLSAAFAFRSVDLGARVGLTMFLAMGALNAFVVVFWLA